MNMKFALFAILFVGFVCLAQSRSIFLDNLFVSQTANVILSCNATDSCAGKGDTCNGVYQSGNCIQNGASAANGTCCADGLFWVNSTCVTDTAGQSCTSSTNCFSSSPTPMNCVSGTCVYIYGPGDSCSNNTDCASGNCTGSVCIGGSYGQSCSTAATVIPSCNFGLYCYLNITSQSTTCQNTTAEGGNCTSSVQCAAGTTCFSSTRTNGTLSQPMCQTIGTQSEGNPCMDNSACDSGTVCYMGNCTSVGTSMTSCTNSTSCGTGAQCVCSYVTGDLYCAGTLYNNPCTDEQISLQSCLASSSCSEATDAPNSCSYANCLSEYKKSLSCRCSFASSVSGGCSYNQYCGGFPVWAIIVIIVVAIVLVLAIVLLVFFMMRRRRQYDSI